MQQMVQDAPIRVAIAGAAGKMGREAVAAMEDDDRFELAAVLIHRPASNPNWANVPAFQDAQALMEEIHPDVWLDLTDATSVARHADLALAANIRPVLGATGYSPADLDRWQAHCAKAHIGAVAAPNFAIGALLMTRFAAEAARFFPHAEIVELHHDGKRDAPSGTAKRTAEAMAQARLDSSATHLAATDLRADAAHIGQARSSSAPSDDGQQRARGLPLHQIPIHSVRLPGLVAHQEVLFGGTGEVLTIRHDSLARTSFMPGILFACAKVMELNQFVYGLEHLLW